MLDIIGGLDRLTLYWCRRGLPWSLCDASGLYSRGQSALITLAVWQAHYLGRQTIVRQKQLIMRSSGDVGGERSSSWQQHRQAMVVIFASVLLALLWQVLRPHYYGWVLGPGSEQVVLFCDTHRFAASDVQALALYDAVALSPPAQMLGLLQQRPAQKVRNYHVVPITTVDVTSYSVTLAAIPKGPLVRVLLLADDQRYHADIPRRRGRHGTIYVHMGNEVD